MSYNLKFMLLFIVFVIYTPCSVFRALCVIDKNVSAKTDDNWTDDSSVTAPDSSVIYKI